MYKLPTHPELRTLDPLGRVEESTLERDHDLYSDGSISQSRLLAAIFEGLVRAGPDADGLLAGAIEDIVYSIHNDGGLDTGYLRSRLQYHPSNTAEKLARCALELSQCFPNNVLPVLGDENEKILINGKQVDALLAHQFFGTLAQPDGNEWGLPCFTSWYASAPHHEKAVRGYIQILLDHFDQGGYQDLAGPFQFQRFTASSMPDPSTCDTIPNFILLPVEEESEPSDRTREGTFVLVSAHSQPGPGPSGTHEERLQATSPALSISSLITPLLAKDAAVVTSSFPVHASWRGHNRTARIEGDLYPHDARPSRHYILADALELDMVPDTETGSLKDLKLENLQREVRKLYAGFHGASVLHGTALPPLVIEAPAWGCRSFGGNVLVKAFCMMVAAGLADVTVHLSLLPDKEQEIEAVQGILKKRFTTKRLWYLLKQAEESGCATTLDLRDVLYAASSGLPVA